MDEIEIEIEIEIETVHCIGIVLQVPGFVSIRPARGVHGECWPQPTLRTPVQAGGTAHLNTVHRTVDITFCVLTSFMM